MRRRRRIFFFLMLMLVLIIAVRVARKGDFLDKTNNSAGTLKTSYPAERNDILKDNQDNYVEDEEEEIIKDSSLDPGNYKITIKHDNEDRYYLLHVPSSIKNRSLVLAFHGGTGTAEIMSEYYGWQEKADKEGFVVAFPNGASRFASGKLATWNAGECCGYGVSSNSDDVGFVNKVISDIKTKVDIDKVFATGMSNGGMLSHRLACEMSNTFSAIAAVAGTNNFLACNFQNPISIMHIHSLQDDHVLYDGGCGPKCILRAETEFVSVSQTISDWVEENNCNQSPTRVLDTNNAYCDLYTGCSNGVQVKLCTTEDGGHSWPGAASTPNPLEKTTPSQAIDATDEIWSFFQDNN